MALTGRHWGFAATAAAALIAVTLLPPSPEWWDRQRRLEGEGRPRAEQVDAAVGRARVTLGALQERETIQARLRRLGPGTAPVLLIVDTVAPRFAARLDSAWREIGPALGPGGTRVVLILRPARDREYRAATYFLPAATDGRSCVAVVQLWNWGFREAQGSPRDWLGRALGPCAFYGAFGEPGPGVAAWLAAVAWQPTYQAAWWLPSQRRVAPDPTTLTDATVDELFRAIAAGPYLGSLDETACAAGRLDRCRGAIAEARVLRRPQPTLVAQGIVVRAGALALWWSPTSAHIPAELVRSFGTERFRRFWTSAAPLDTAFAAAFGEGLDPWLSAWLSQGRSIRVGPAIRPTSIAISLLLAAAVVAAATAWTMRRQVA